MELVCVGDVSEVYPIRCVVKSDFFINATDVGVSQFDCLKVEKN